MAIRRRRKTLTNLLSTMENRVSAVELRPIKLLTDAQVKAALADEDAPLDGGPDSVAGLDAPNQYKRVTEGYYYSGRVTGGKSRVELYFTANPELEAGKTVRVSGIYSLVNGVKIVPMNLTGDFKTVGTDTPPWDDRATYNGKRHTPGAEVDSAVLFDPVVATEYSDRKALIVKSRIASVEATVTTAKVIFTTTNYFKVGDVIYVDMPSDSPYYGLDGLFRIKEIGSNFITYDFASEIPEPLNSAVVTDERYVHAVAQSAVRDGATYVDTGPNPDIVYVWKDIRWVTFNSAAVPKDDNAPGPITNLEAADENDTPDGSAIGASRVTLTWTAPDVNADNTPIDDLIGYTVWWRQYVTQEWERSDVTGIDTNWSHSGFLQGKPAYFRVYARDSGGNLSTGVDLSYTTGVFAPMVSTPKAPSVSTYLGTIKIAYDDLTAAGLVQAGSAKEIEVYFSDINGFTPGPTNFYGKFPANAGSYIIIPGTEIVDATDYYIKIIVRDIYGNITAPSDQASIRAKISDIVTFDMIDVGTLTGQVIIGLDIRTSSNPSVNGGIIMNQQGITAYDPSGGQTFRVDATNGQVSIGDYLGKADAAGLYLGVEDAKQNYATVARADGIALVAGTAQGVANAASSTASAAQTAADLAAGRINAITTIEPGNITVISKEKIVTALNAGLSSNTTQIAGGTIITGTLLASRIGSGNLPVGVINTGTLNADNIDAGTLTGRLVRSSASGTRVELDATNDRLAIYNGTTLRGTVFGDTLGVRLRGNGVANIRVAANDITLTGESTSNFLSIGEAGGVASFSCSSNSVRFGILGNGTTTKRYVFANESGGLFATTSITGVSDARLKKDIAPSTVGLNLVNMLNPVVFNWKHPAPDEAPAAKLQHGLIAQELKSALEDNGVASNSIVVEEPSQGYESRIPDLETNPVLAIDYTQLVPILIRSIQELSVKIDRLNDEIDKLKDKN